MLKFFRRRLVRVGRDERGFTIVELLVVITVVGILAGVGVSGYSSFRDRANRAAADAAWRDLQVAINLYQVENGTFPRNSAGGSTTNDEIEAALEEALENLPTPLRTNLWNEETEAPAADIATGFLVATLNVGGQLTDVTCVYMGGQASQFNSPDCPTP